MMTQKNRSQSQKSAKKISSLYITKKKRFNPMQIKIKKLKRERRKNSERSAKNEKDEKTSFWEHKRDEKNMWRSKLKKPQQWHHRVTYSYYSRLFIKSHEIFSFILYRFCCVNISVKLKKNIKNYFLFNVEMRKMKEPAEHNGA